MIDSDGSSTPSGPGGLARDEIEALRESPRSLRGSRAPFADFWDAMREIDVARRSAIFAQARLARLDAEPQGPGAEAHVAWEQSELARAAEAGDFLWLNSSTVWSLHAALDALVEDLSPAVRHMTADVLSRRFVAQAATENPELASQLAPGAVEAITRAAAQVLADQIRPRRVRGNGAERWEGSLTAVGFGAPPGRPVPVTLDRALIELCVIRDVLTHRGGRVDSRASADCPWLGLEVGAFARVSSHQARRYSAAVGAYGSEVIRRVLDTAGLGTPLDLADWTRHGFLV